MKENEEEGKGGVFLNPSCEVQTLGVEGKEGEPNTFSSNLCPRPILGGFGLEGRRLKTFQVHPIYLLKSKINRLLVLNYDFIMKSTGNHLLL